MSVVEKHLHKWDRVKDAFYQKTSEEMVSIVVSVVEKHLHKWDRVKGAFYKKASEKKVSGVVSVVGKHSDKWGEECNFGRKASALMSP
ncbi:TPA: hypothetical protein JLC50_004062 [Escherichia coli]|nr:hypothetical protein [Escherichia coli]